MKDRSLRSLIERKPRLLLVERIEFLEILIEP